MRSGRTAPLGMLHPRSSSTPIRTGLAWHRSQLRWRWCNKWGKVRGNAVENMIVAEPNSLTIFEALPPRNNSHPLRVEGRFWLTPSVLLSRPYIPEYHHTGEVRIRRGKKWTFCLNL